MADVRDFKPKLSSSRLFSKGTKDLDSGVVDDSVFNRMTASFESKNFLTDNVQFEYSAPLIYQLDLLKEDIDDIHSHLSESKFTDSKQKFPVVDVTKEFYVTGTTTLEGNTTIEGFTDIKGDFKVNGSTISNLKPALEFSDSLRTKTLISSSAQMASNISGSFTTLSASIATDIGNAGGGTIDSSLTNGSTNAVQNNAVYDGLALKLNLSGGTMSGVALPRVIGITGSPNKGAQDMRAGNVLEVTSKQAVTLTTMTPAGAGQEVTITNLGQGAITITHSAKPNPTGFFIYGGSNLTIATAQAYKFIYSGTNRLWLLVQ